MRLPQKLQSLLNLASRQPVRYLIVAGCTSLGYLGLLAAGLALGWFYILAILAAQAVTIACAFPIYRKFVFGVTSSRVWVDFVRFLTVWGAGAVAGLIVTPALVEILKWNPFASQVVAIALVSCLSFLGHRYFSFKTSKRQVADCHGDREA